MTDFSILDLVPVSQGSDAGAALRQSGDLALLGDELGFKRLWYAEHHGMPAIASSSPEVLIAHAASLTRHIRVGSGGVMLPNHVPLRIVETYRTLSALYSDRIDLGLGRAGGTDHRTLQALRSFGGEQFADQVAELVAYERGQFPDQHPFAEVKVVPDTAILPPVWILGSSGASAKFAGEYGFGYGFAAHFSQSPAGPAFGEYKAAFKPSTQFEKPHALLCIAAICAGTAEEAAWLAGSMKLTWRNLFANEPDRIQSPETAAAYPFTPAEERALTRQMTLVMVGTPDQVADQIRDAASTSGAQEVMIASNLYDHETRLQNYRLLAKALEIKPRS